MAQQFFVIELEFADPGEVAQGLNLFYEAYSEKIDDVISVVNYTTAHAEPTRLSVAMPEQQRQVSYRFRFIITYMGKQILNPVKN